MVGLKIKQLRPEHTIKQIADWANDPVSVAVLIKVFHAAFQITCKESTTFRTLVEMIAATTRRRTAIADVTRCQPAAKNAGTCAQQLYSRPFFIRHRLIGNQLGRV